jgi:ABC-type Fe3+/spermidine/putrescine transport system ATPase subunit
MPPFLVLDRLAKSFGPSRVLRGLSLAVERGEVVALLGPSGSGKTTALRLIAGFETPDADGPGRVLIEGEDITGLPPARRGVGMVFQHFALFPHLSVGGNVAFGLRGDAAAVRRRVAEVLALVDMAGFERRGVGEISGGQQQRVALARALAPEPRLLLLDEPLSNLDPALRERTRRELERGIRKVGITTVLVTHEQEEAFHLADRVAVLEGGELHQVGSPEDLYERPATRFVASFVGRASALAGRFVPGGAGGTAGGTARSGDGAQGAAAGPPGPATGTAAGARVRIARVEDAAEGARVRLAPAEDAMEAARVHTAPVEDAAEGARVRLAPAEGEAGAAVEWEGVPIAPPAAGEAAVLVLRPEALRLVPPGTPGSLAGRVVERRFAGAVTYYQVALELAAGPAGSNGCADTEVEVSAGSRDAAVGDAVAVAPSGAGPVPCIFAAESR